MPLWLRRLSIQTRMMVGIALAAGVLVVSLGIYWSEREERELSAALEQRADRLSQLLSRSLAGPIWNLDTLAMTQLLDAAVADPEVQAVEVQASGVDVASLNRRVGPADKNPLVRDVDVNYQGLNDAAPNVVGRLHMEFTRELVRDSVARTGRFVASLLAVVLAAIIVTSYLLVRRLVTQPVAALGALAQRVAEGELGAVMPVVREDDIGRLTERFNSMSRQLQSGSEGLRRSEQRYRSLFENATEGIFQADARGRLLGINRALAQMLGLKHPERAIGHSLRKLARIELGEYRRLALALQRHRLLQQVPLLVLGEDGRELWVELSVHVVPDPSQQRLYIEGMVSDISLRRQAEQELTQHRDHLEELVAERTAELSQAKLRAEEASRSKSRFLATMSHEFRTPLNAILGFAQLLQMDPSLSAAQMGKVNLVRDSGEHLLSLISDLLDMASIEAGRVKLLPTVVDLRALLEVAGDSVRLRAEEKKLRLSVQLDPELPMRARADGQRLRQVVLNLLSNAVKFTDRGQVLLRAQVLSQDAHRVRLRIEVQDSGIGMSAEQVERLFRPFEQVSDISRRDGGTGLGLSISQQLIRLMGSQISVHSVPGDGSRFSFDLDLSLPG